MTAPSVTLNQLDNQVGVVDPGTGDTLAIVAPCSGGAALVNIPGIYSRKSDVVAAFGGGPLVEAACYELETTGKSVVLVKCATTTAASYSAITTSSGGGTSVATADGVVLPIDDYEVVIKWITGGTIGVTGITYQESLDGGRTYSATKSLGTATSLTTADGQVKLNFAAGTIIAGRTDSCRTTAAKPNSAQITAALDALRTTANKWNMVLVEIPILAADLAAIAASVATMRGIGLEVTAIGGYRVPTSGESETAYKTAFDTEFGASVADDFCLTAGSIEVMSAVTQRRYMRRAAHDLAVAAVAVRPGQDLAEVGGLGPRPATVRLKDDANNPKHHDELLDPGLDDSRASTYRTWYGRKGVFITNARLMSASGSDFVFLQHRRVMNLCRRVVRRELELFSSADLLVNETTGRILEEEAAAIDAAINAALEEEVKDTRNATAAVFQLSRTDNILSTFTLRGALRVTPLAYPKTIIADVGFYNPALRASTPTE